MKVQLPSSVMHFFKEKSHKRRLIISMVANPELHNKTLAITWKKPFDLVAKRPFPKNGRGAENRTRSNWSQTSRTTGILHPED